MFENFRHKAHEFFYSQIVIPFETCFSFFCIYSGVASLMKFGVVSDIFENVIGTFYASLFNIGFILAGLCLYLGTGLRRRDLEMCGLITIGTSLLIRSIALGWMLGLNPLIVNSYILNVAFIVACVVRGITLYNYKISIQAVARKQ